MTTDLTIPAGLTEALLRAEKVVVTAHARPDGDAMGSCLALAEALRALGRRAVVFNEDGVPGFLRFLRSDVPVLDCLDALPFEPDLAVVLDCGDRARAGEAVQPLLDRVPTLDIDHHLANPCFGSAGNWVEPSAAATGELVALIVKALGVPLEGALAEALYVAVSSDTGNFSYGNTTPLCLRLTAEMLERGLPVAELREKLENNWAETKLRLWGRLMQEARLLEGGRLAVAMVTREALRSLGASREDSEGFVEQLRRLSGVRAALLLREEEKDGRVQTKASLRSSGGDNVRDAAAAFGGGGHKNAAGATLAMDAEAALAAMLPHLRTIWADD